MKIKKIIAYASLCMLSLGLQAQKNISGKTTYNQKPLSGVSVILLKEDSSYLKDVETDSTGSYTIENIKEGGYKLLFSLIGYNKKTIDIKVVSKDVQMSEVDLEMETFVMNEVTVKAKRLAFKVEPGKTTVNLSEASLGSNGSLLNALEKIPGILILNDGTVLLNGKAGANVMIDGKLTYLTGENLLNLLRAMPSSAVDKIEMVSHPSAQYDAGGTSGFINIKSKQKTDNGLNLNVSSNIETGKYLRQNQNLSLQLHRKKYTFYTNYAFNNGQDFILINSSREYLKTKTAHTDAAILGMDADRKFKSHSHYFKSGIDYQFSEKLSLSSDVYGNWFDKNKNETALSEFFQSSGLKDFSLYTQNEQYSNHSNLGSGMSVLYKISQKVKWENVFNFLVFEQKEKLNQNSTMNTASEGNSENGLQGKMGGKIQISNLQSDFNWKMSDKYTFHSGLKYSSITIDNRALYNSFESGEWIEDEKLSSSFLYKENILAGYLQSGQKWSKRFSTEAGLRVELTDTEARYKTGIMDSTLVRNYGGLFPTFSANYIVTENNTLAFQYGRRIVRPNYRDLNPFTEVNDRYLQERGNTALRPERVNNLEVSWLIKKQYVFSFFYTTRKNPITKSYLTEPESDVTIVMPLNLKQSYSLGVRASLNNIKPIDWWILHLNGSLTYKEFHWQEMEFIYNNNLWTPTFQFNNQFALPKEWAVEATGYYYGTMAEGQAKIGSIGSVSLGARKSFFENKLSLYAYFNDVFLTNRQNISLFNSVISGDYRERRDTRMIGITLSWRFDSGSSSKSIRKIDNMEESKRIN
ncbi:TonB-dependent receptor domain-containing protein [Flavobacterium procerum]|uniref:TonB-dependent receptor domain-containing protein n=1 Tax=Flavobacterium procerum TaxID=1455569 RepID=A0ABV6BVR6_9FLAO